MKPHYWGREARRFFVAGAQKSTIEKCSLSILEDMFRVIEKAPVQKNRGFGADKRTWTSMKLPSYGPEPYASANSAISALLVEGDGFEPSKSSTADLQSAPFSHSGTLPYWVKLASGAGGRTWTVNLLITNQLLCQLSYTSMWCLRVESNHRHRDFQSLALPTELPRQNDGDLDGARTHDL